MKAGDVCRCISDFSGVLTEELTVYKNDILQVRSVVDRFWVEAEGGGSVGKVPSSVLVKTELPKHPCDTPLYVAAADFRPSQEGDLGFARGDFIVGLYPVDASWWYGETFGKKGIFPLSFVWKIEENIIDAEDTSEKPVRMRGIVRLGSKAQLPEELDLYKGDIVNITHIVDGDWYRGESNGAIGIFPCSFVDILENPSGPPVSATLPESEVLPEGSDDGHTDPRDDYSTRGTGNEITSTGVSCSISASSTVTQAPICNSQVSLSKISTHWKTIDDDIVDDLLQDDYFRKNMPGLVSSDISNQSITKDSSEIAFSNQSATKDSSEIAFSNQSATKDISETPFIIPPHSNVNKQYSTVSSPGYNEDNTGIEPYGRAVFSFKAQYPNELTFKKGDIIYLIKHIDSHWTLGHIGNSKGIFPTSYVDIIVNCLYNEEEIFLARTEIAMQTSYLGYAKAEYNFDAVESSDITMVKGDILKVIKFVDDNWAVVENTNGCKGMCPQNYLSLLFELTLNPQENNSQMLGTQPEETSCKRESRPLTQNASFSRSRSTSPYNASVSRRLYSKDNFGSIKQQEVESVLAKNVASLDVACKSSHTEKRLNESVFIERENDEQKSKPEAAPRMVPPRISKTTNDVVTAHTMFDNQKSNESISSTVKKPAVFPRTRNIPPVPPRVNVGRVDSIKSVSDDSMQDTFASGGGSVIAESVSVPEVQSPVEPIYSQVQKRQLSGKPSSNRPHLHASRKESAAVGDSLGHLGSLNSASFPDDVSSSSLTDKQTYSSEASIGSASPTVLPHRPVPPPPPKICESGFEERDDYYSLPPEGETDGVPDHEGGTPQPEVEGTISLDPERLSSGDGNTQSTTIIKDINTNQENSKITSKTDIRRELMQEIVTTEHEYIHDLEALMQVIRLAPSQKESQAVDLTTLMGNVSEVVSIAKKLLSHLDAVAYENDENMLIGRVFLLCASDLCDIYKRYCSNHNVAAEPLLKKYTEEPEPAAFLQWVLSELQQHKIQLMDMRSVLIKPVQRVLKYPLFLDRLVTETPSSHADYQDLTEAKTKMANVAKEINEYTKRLDLICKYRNAVDQSLQSKMQRVTMHSVAKKSARLSAIVSEKLGIMTTTKDPDFDEEETKFRCVQRAALSVVQDADLVLQAVKARHRTELEICKALMVTLVDDARMPIIEAILQTTLDTCNRILEMFESFVNKRITQPASQLVSLCDVPERLIAKRYHKLLDFDNAQYKLDRNKDPSRTRILEEELLQAKGTYEALNTQLMMELPVLTATGTDMLTLSVRSLVASRMYLQGHLAKLYLQLAQVPGLSYAGEEEMLAQFRVKYLHQVGEFRHLSFIPTESLQRTLPRTKPRGKKSADNSVARKDVQEGVRKKVLSKYPVGLIYLVSEVHTPGEVFELTLYPGDHVALLKNKDPLGNSERWFVDDGDNKGFVRASCLKPFRKPDESEAAVTALPPSIDTTIPHSTQTNPSIPSRPSTLPSAAAQTPQLPERPPRYEDLFPSAGVATSNTPHFTGFGTSERQRPPPCYLVSQEMRDLQAQTPLPSKLSCKEPFSSVGETPQALESEHYSPPMDRQQSNEYNSPLSEESNIYEEIDQVREYPSEKIETDVADSCPIYEVIEDDGSLQETDLPTKSETNLPEPECDTPQFYYALYNFGGSDCTQLSLTAGQVVLVIEAISHDWWFVEDRNGKQGYVPASYLTKYS